MGGYNRTPVKKTMPSRLICLIIDLALVAALLLSFAYFHHVRPKTLDEGQEIVVKPPDDENTPDFSESDGTEDGDTPDSPESDGTEKESEEKPDVTLAYCDSGSTDSGLYSVLLENTSAASLSSVSFRLTYNNVRLTYLTAKPYDTVKGSYTLTETDNGDSTSTLLVSFASEEGSVFEQGTVLAVLFTANVDLTGLTPYKIEAENAVADGVPKTVSVIKSKTLTAYGDFRDIYPDEFSASGIELDTDTEFKSENVHVTWREVYDTTTWGKNVRYTVADIYVRSADYLKAYVSVDGTGALKNTKVGTMANTVGAIVAINSDYISCRDSASTLLVRNGINYSAKNKTYRYNADLLVMLANGTMKIISYNKDSQTAQTYDFTGENIVNIWSFGPTLLNSEGKAMSKEWYYSKVKPANPRTAIGYYAPGHYCFICIEGRNKTENITGLRIEELGTLCEMLGCTLAYNLDGGDSSVMTWNGSVINRPSGSSTGRASTDIIYVVKE